MRGYEQYSWADIRHLLELRIPMRGYEGVAVVITNPTS